MRKIILSLCVCFMAVASAQVSVPGKRIILEEITGKDTVTVIIFDSITNASEITYTGTATTINWYKYPTNTFVSNQPTNNPEDSTGYLLVADGDSTYYWVIDYNKNRPVFNSFQVEDKPKDQCENMNLLIDASVSLLSYQTPDSVSHNLPRNFTVNYKTSAWTDKWSEIQAPTQEIVLPASQITVPTPLCDTYFTLAGDQYGKELGFTTDSISSSFYSTVAIQFHITSSVFIRNEKNEDERPSQKTQVSGSAPLDIQFESNANESAIPKFYRWEIYKNNEFLIDRTDKDFRNLFTDAGTYKVKLVTNNEFCSYTDSITITVSESLIDVPNVFTPNGDGANDEFRVAYRSIISFEAWVYNRWGRLVFHWTDPQKGWDGNINGRKAAVGPYYYVIKALGSDFNPESEPINKKTKLRLGEYLKKGDINLLRGKE